jgi:predicted nucleic acid-binding protein
MDEELILETTFLIDLEREKHRGPGAAVSFLRERPSARLFLTPTIRGELACGLSMADREKWRTFVEPFRVLPVDEEAEWQYGEIFRNLRAMGQGIGGNDLWIATVALSYGMSLVTANEVHFRRIPGLRVLSYR